MPEIMKMRTMPGRTKGVVAWTDWAIQGYGLMWYDKTARYEDNTWSTQRSCLLFSYFPFFKEIGNRKNTMMEIINRRSIPGRPKGVVSCNGLLQELHKRPDSLTECRSHQCNWIVISDDFTKMMMKMVNFLFILVDSLTGWLSPQCSWLWWGWFFWEWVIDTK